MEDNIDIILFNKFVFSDQYNSKLPWITVSMTAGVYAVWTMFVLPGFRKVPWKLKVPYLPSGKTQTANVMKLLQGRKGRLVDLGSGDGRLVFAASSLGFQSTGYELNPILINWAKTQAWRKGFSEDQVTFLSEDFWSIVPSTYTCSLGSVTKCVKLCCCEDVHGPTITADLSKYNNVTVFLAPNVVEALEKKLSAELSEDARVIVCRFPLSKWQPTCTEGASLDQVWAYDMVKIRKNPHHNWSQQLP